MNSSKHQMSVQRGYVLIERPHDYEVLRSEQPEFLMEISAFCETAGYRKVLILGPRTKVKLSTSEIYHLGEEIAKLGLRIAVVESHDVSNNDVKFLENVAANRGSPIQFFANEEHAKEWLGIS